MKTANVKFLTLELAALKDYKRELSEKQMPNTAVIIFISLYLIFLPGNSLFFGGGGGWEGRRKAYFPGSARGVVEYQNTRLNLPIYQKLY